MNGFTTITTKGQVTIPEEVRQALGVKIGDKVSFKNLKPDFKEAVIKIISSDIVEELSGSLVSRVKLSESKKARKESGKLLVKKYKIK